MEETNAKHHNNLNFDFDYLYFFKKMFFYLEWNDKRPIDCKLLEEKPGKLNFESVFVLKRRTKNK